MRLAVENELRTQRTASHAVRTEELPSEDTGDGHSQHFLEQLDTELDAQELTRLADQTWLGPQSADFQTRLLVAKVVFSDGKRLGHGLAVLRRLNGSQKFKSVEQFLSYLCDPTVVRTLFFQSLDFKPPALYAHLVNTDSSHSKSLTPYLRCRYGYYEPKRLIAQRVPEELQSEFESVVSKWQSKLPFEPIATRFTYRLRRAGCDTTVFEKDPLWKRLIFQYHLYSASHEDILEWIGPAASHCGAKLDRIKLHGWISVKRLERELTKEHSSGGPNG